MVTAMGGDVRGVLSPYLRRLRRDRVRDTCFLGAKSTATANPRTS
jgi:hypothetical protein